MQSIDKKTIIFSISTLAVGLLIGWLLFGGSPSHDQTSVQESHQHETTSEIWTCSMHPQIRQHEPGKCPICGMDLIPVDDSGNDLDPMAISMSPTAMKLANVQTMVVGIGSHEKSIRVNGKVQADERQIYTQSSHIPGRIERLMVNFTGDFVRQGQIIAYVFSPELVVAQEELFEAKKIKEQQPTLYRSAIEKLKNWKLTDSQIEKILQSDQAIEQFPILSNVSGYVEEKFVNVGDYIKLGQPVYKIADLSKIWVLFDVYEKDLQWIHQGNQVNFTIESLPGKTFSGKISYVDPIIDPKTRVAKARVELKNTDLQLKPEMFVSGEIYADNKKGSSVIVVPKSSVMWTGKRSIIYVKETSEQGVYFLLREVTLGPEMGNGYQIESGLEEGEEIAVNGTFSIDAAAQLSGKSSMMNPEMSKMTSMSKQSHIQLSATDMQLYSTMIKSYIDVKDQMVKGEAISIISGAESFAQNWHKFNAQILAKRSDNDLRMKSEMIIKASHGIVSAKTTDQARKHFIDLNSSLIPIFQQFGGTGESLYVQHCPMANDNNGADWISLENEIRNPYYGDMMLTCGEVTTIIK